MRRSILTAVAPLLACVLVIALTSVAGAFPSYGTGCAGCHSGGDNGLATSPNPIDIDVASNGLITFDVNPLVSSTAVLVLSGLEDPDLDASIGAGGDAWQWNGSHYLSGSSATDRITSAGPYTLDLVLGLNAVEGLYDQLEVWLIGGGGKPGLYSTFGVNVIPEPGSILLLLSGSMLCLVGFRRRRDA